MGWMFIIIAIACFAIAIMLAGNTSNRNQKWVQHKQQKAKMDAALNELDARIIQIIKAHLSTLSKKHSQLTYVNDYGVLDGLEAWKRELEYFRDNVIELDAEYQALFPKAAHLYLFMNNSTLQNLNLDYLASLVENSIANYKESNELCELVDNNVRDIHNQ